MANERTPGNWGGVEEPPSEVQITVLAERDAPRPRVRSVALLVAASAVLGAVVAIAGSPGIRPQRVPAAARADGPLGVAAAYGYPLRCLSVTIAATDPSYARADFDHAVSCGRYDGYSTAIFHRIDDVWRPVLDAINYSCPVAVVPSSVQSELGVCPAR
jgi:hypothetical protein